MEIDDALNRTARTDGRRTAWAVIRDLPSRQDTNSALSYRRGVNRADQPGLVGSIPGDPVTPPRRGARRPSEVPDAVLAALEAGAPSMNHMEQMAMNFGRLLVRVVPEASHRTHEMASPNFLTRMRAGARIVWDEYGDELFGRSSGWTSDTARGWAAFAVPLTKRSLTEQLLLAQQFAADDHFAVREWAWLGVRPTVADDPLASVEQLRLLTSNTSARLRRFACEVLRPRGVWSPHIALLKVNPEVGLPVVEPLVVDGDRYVRDSVANWLNDASKHQPSWVAEQCARWTRLHGTDVEYVVKRGTRSLT